MLATVGACTALLGALPAQAASDNFTITNYHVGMRLERRADQHSQLETTETITALFPSANSNHGIERSFVKKYNGHTTKFELQSVQDENGQDIPYHWNGDTLRIGSKGTYVHGSKTYVIRYKQQDVVRDYNDTKATEFYWDAIGTEWRVPIAQAQVDLDIVGGDVRAARSGKAYCYYGSKGASTRCTITEQESGSPSLTAHTRSLRPGEGMTIALGFRPGTFAQYQKTWAERVIDYMDRYGAWAIAGVSGITLLLLLARMRREGKHYRAARAIMRRPLVAEYLPPKHYSVLESAVVTNRKQAAVTALLLDLAVRHYIEIRQTKEKSFLRSAAYRFVVQKSMETLGTYEQALVRALFGGMPAVGDSVTLANIRLRASNISSATSRMQRAVEQSKLYANNKPEENYFDSAAVITLVLLIVILVAAGFMESGRLAFIGGGAMLLLCIVAFIGSSRARSRKSAEGAELVRYLQGLKRYISVAEADRLRMLQSPQAVEKVGDIDAATNRSARLKLYERVLPYAVLFGQERQWMKEMGNLYEATGTQPTWATGGDFMRGAMFAALASDMSSSVTQASNYSSSSGGSTGGGFSGGGGGGGGGGGW